jgi:hypothetical protein
MPSSSYQPAPSSVEEYLQQLMQRGFIAAAAIAHLIREVREGYIDSDIPVGSHISWPDPDGCFSIEIAAGPPVPARNYRCRERSRAERIAYLHERDQRRALGGAGGAPSRAAQDVEPSSEQQPTAAPGVKAPEVVDEETPKPVPMATAAEEPFKTGAVEITKTMRQQGTLEPAITKWLLAGKTKPTPSGKPFLSANSMRYLAQCQKKFPGVYHHELKRALLDARQQLDLVKKRPHQKGQSRSKQRLKKT